MWWKSDGTVAEMWWLRGQCSRISAIELRRAVAGSYEEVAAEKKSMSFVLKFSSSPLVKARPQHYAQVAVARFHLGHCSVLIASSTDRRGSRTCRRGSALGRRRRGDVDPERDTGGRLSQARSMLVAYWSGCPVDENRRQSPT
jgi:hypothetical protein